MASIIYPVSQVQHPGYQSQRPIKQTTEQRHHVVAFVPTLVELQTPVRKVMTALHWRRQLSDFLGSFVSGAVSLR